MVRQRVGKGCSGSSPLLPRAVSLKTDKYPPLCYSGMPSNYHRKPYAGWTIGLEDSNSIQTFRGSSRRPSSLSSLSGISVSLQILHLFTPVPGLTIFVLSTAVLQPLLPHLPLVLTVVGLSGVLGTTMGLSLLADLLSVLTAHLYVAYLVATVSFRWMKMMLGTLFNVFRGECRPISFSSGSPADHYSFLAGKRVNVLRNRLDSNDYTVDQLLLGTVLFTLFAFLFPTVLAYYLFFATVSSPPLRSALLLWPNLAESSLRLSSVSLRRHLPSLNT